MAINKEHMERRLDNVRKQDFVENICGGGVLFLIRKVTNGKYDIMQSTFFAEKNKGVRAHFYFVRTQRIKCYAKRGSTESKWKSRRIFRNEFSQNTI